MIKPDWQTADGSIRLYRGDCLEVMPEMTDTVDLVVTSPPYDALRAYGGEWVVDLPAVGREVYSLLADGGVAVMVIQDQTKDFKKSLTSFRTIVAWCDAGLSLFECLIYQRHGTPGGWWNKRFRVDHEYMPVFFKGERPHYFDKLHLMVSTKTRHRKQEFASRLTSGAISKKHNLDAPCNATKCRGTIWDYTSAKQRRDKRKNWHPATFPDELPLHHIQCWTRPGDTVLDPFLGSGTTAVACINTGRRFIGIERDPGYFDLAVSRLETALGNVGLFAAPASPERSLTHV